MEDERTMEIIKLGGLFLGLGCHSVVDVWRKKLSFYGIGIFAGIGLAVCLLEKRELLAIGLSLLPGVVLLLLAYSTRQRIGYGDGALVCAMGLYLDAVQLLEVCLIAFFLAGIVGVFVLLFRKKHKEDEMAFVPFLFVACVIERWLSKCI